MRKLVLFFFLIAVCAPAALAQRPYHKYEIYTGFSHARVDTGIGDSDTNPDDIVKEREGFNGFEIAALRMLARHAGLKVDYTYHRKSFDVFDGIDTFNINATAHTLVGGIQLKDNSSGDWHVKPFAHAMAGLTHAGFKIAGLDDFRETETGFAAVIGGGIDIKVNDRVDFRAIQFDYNPTRLGGETQHNFRVGIGIAFR